MPLLEKIQILKTGKVPDAVDPAEDEIITIKDLDELVETYDPEIHEAPIVLGHDADTEPGFLSSDTHPAYGWIEKVYRDGKDLYVDIDASDEFKDLLDKKFFKKRSIAYYNRDSRTNPTPGKLSMRHVAYLGATPPRVKGLSDTRLSEKGYKNLAKFSDHGEGYKVNETIMFQEENKVATKEEAKEILNNNAKEWIAFILQDGQKGFKGGIKGLDPEPNEENFWLFNKDANQWEGVFIAKDDRRFNFIIKDEDDGEWRMGFRLEEEGEPDLTESSEENDQLSEEESTEMADKVVEKKVKKTKDGYEVDPPKEMAENGECPDKDKTEMMEVKNHNPGGDTKEDDYMDMKKMTETEMKEYMEEEMKEYMEKYMEKFMEKYMKKMGYGKKDHDEDKDKEKMTEYTEEEMSELESLREEATALREQLAEMKKAKDKEMETEMMGFSESLYSQGKLTEEIVPKAALQSILSTLLKAEEENMLYFAEANNKDSLTHVYEGLVNLLGKLPKLGEDLQKMGELDIPKTDSHISGYSEKYSKDSQDFDAQIRKYSEQNKVSYVQAYKALKHNH